MAVRPTNTVKLLIKKFEDLVPVEQPATVPHHGAPGRSLADIKPSQIFPVGTSIDHQMAECLLRPLLQELEQGSVLNISAERRPDSASDESAAAAQYERRPAAVAFGKNYHATALAKAPHDAHALKRVSISPRSGAASPIPKRATPPMRGATPYVTEKRQHVVPVPTLAQPIESKAQRTTPTRVVGTPLVIDEPIEPQLAVLRPAVADLRALQVRGVNDSVGLRSVMSMALWVSSQ
eukprot:TRINITY_DN3614_c0_g1_i1.p1 TRINITY_DN3614_c0_g1~~TRINITY_DN3614_c0_g1_i1.p1  ORF type:complete len:236 (-),score=3.60 TRINITY_DN3614_c0_g1_i1:1040-1747(-)